MVELLNEDLAREYQAIIAYTVYSNVLKGAQWMSIAGELKKQLPMVTEGSVVYAASPPSGSAPDVAPEGFAHPVFRAGFALSIPLPEGR